MSKNEVTITIRWIEEADVVDVLDAEARSNMFTDPDFEVEAVAPWAWDKDDLMTAIRKYTQNKKGERSTYTAVATIPIEVVEPNGQTSVADWVCGAISYEKINDGFTVDWFTIHPSCIRETILRAFSSHLVNNATRSKRRKHLTMYLRDCDQAGIREFIPALKNEGWSIKLVRNHYENGMDGWKCELVVPETADTEGGEAQKLA